MAAEASQSSDRLLWLAAGAIVVMGLAWLLIEAPWSGGEPPAARPPGPQPEAAANVVAAKPASPARDPLHLARLALEAGMLVEPADYSAWSLFGEAAAADPGNAEAAAGLAEVADALIGRGRAALEQGRFDDAEAIPAIILERLPEHVDALALEADIETALAPPLPVAPPPRERRAEAAAPPPEAVDPIPDLHAAFLEAMAANAVLTPAGASARDILREMLAADAAHALAVDARNMLVTEMLDRSAQSIEALDTAAARTWIDAAAALADDPARIETAEARLTDHLIAQEQQKIVPASALTQISFAAPEYPDVALERGIEGWVEVGFTVAADGSTGEIEVLEASHERFFDAAALAAVGAWRFEPVVFMGRAIPRRAYTRLQFVLD